MMYALQRYYPIADQTAPHCGICLTDEVKPYVIHEGNHGIKHPFHENCLQKWIELNPTCPLCRVKIIHTKRDHSLTRKESRLVMIIVGLALGMMFSIAMSAKFPEQFNKKNQEALTALIVGTALGVRRFHVVKPLYYFTTAFTLAVYWDVEWLN